MSEKVEKELEAALGLPITLEANEYLAYQLIGAKIENATLLTQMYTRELQRAELELAKQSQEARNFAEVLQSKYGVDLAGNPNIYVTEQGRIEQRPQRQQFSARPQKF